MGQDTPNPVQAEIQSINHQLGENMKKTTPVRQKAGKRPESRRQLPTVRIPDTSPALLLRRTSH
jgi:hypothetical protein